jgi:hypothetical protein
LPETQRQLQIWPRVLPCLSNNCTLSDRKLDSSTPDEVKYFTPATAGKQMLEALPNQGERPYLDYFQDFTQEDPFAVAIFTSLGDNGNIRDVGAISLACELKIYEVRYNSRGQQCTVLIGADRSWSMPKCQDLDLDSALILTRFYTQEQDLERSELLIQSPYLVSALQEVITEYPGVNIQSKVIVIRDLPECIFHYRTELQKYGADLVDMAPRKHLGLLFQHCFNVLKLHLDRYYSSMVFSNSPGLNFDDLWMAFRPGDLLYRDIDGRVNAMRLVSMRRSNPSTWLLAALTVSCDGTNFGYEQVYCEIQQYEGYVSLEQLPIFPLKHHTDVDNLRVKLEERGRNYVSLFGAHFKHYVGMAKLSARQELNSSASGTGVSRWRDVYVSQRNRFSNRMLMDFKVNSRIMIDFQGFSENNPSCRAVLSDVIASADEVQHRLSSDDYIICSDLLPGFDLKNKEWCLFNINLVTEINFNTTAFESLFLGASHKELFSSLVQSFFNPSSKFDDIISGKGRGLVFLLHGVPGVGKTLTAGEHTVLQFWVTRASNFDSECVAEQARRPLYAVTIGEIGIDPVSVEQSLDKIFRLSTSWNAILLLDEADVFLEQSSAGDLIRNSIVSGMYYT